MNQDLKLYVKNKVKGKEVEFFDTKGLLETYPGCQYYIVVGQRSNGKTYSALKYLIDRYFETNECFLYIRRYKENLKGNLMDTVFNDFTKYLDEEHNCRIEFYRQTFRIVPADIEEDYNISKCPIIGYTASLTDTEKMKSTAWPTVTTIMFEEFIAVQGYMPDEVNLLMQVISTVFRNRKGCKVLLLGNSIAKRNPYTEALGISIKDYEKGKTEVIESIQGKVKTRICLHRCKVMDKTKEEGLSEGFTSFGNTNYGTMIVDGDFEVVKGNRHIAGQTIPELLKYVPSQLKSKKYKNNFKGSNFYIAYLDQFYRIYMNQEVKNTIVVFKKVPGIEKACNILLSSNTDHTSKDYKIITNLAYHGLQEGTGNLNKLLKIVSAVKSNLYITEDDDDNTNIIHSFKDLGMMLEIK